LGEKLHEIEGTSTAHLLPDPDTGYVYVFFIKYKSLGITGRNGENQAGHDSRWDVCL